jgi:hypothetical protein
MANGAAVTPPFAPRSAPADAASKPGEPIENTIGAATAAAACALAQALTEHQNGQVRPETRLAEGERIAKMFELQEATLGAIDFPAVAREHGRRTLRTYFDADFYRCHGRGASEVAMSVLIDVALEVLSKVTAHERARAN